jgi:glucosamine--fructose-6-phosphate aminotransferase (isomerizing)
MNTFLADVRDQGRAYRDTYERYLESGDALDAAVDALRRREFVLFSGMGSSLAAAYSITSALSEHGLSSFVVEAGELVHYQLAAARKSAALVLISQSGRSAETRAVAEALSGRPHRPPIIVITNDPSSPLAGLADVVLELSAGPESSVASKTYAATLAVLHRMLEVYSGLPLVTAVADRLAECLNKIAGNTSQAEHAASQFSDARALYVVGRGPALAAAKVGALTIKETSAMPAEALTGGAFRHGPIELLTEQVGVVVLAPPGRTQHLARGLADEITALNPRCWLIGDPDSLPGNDGPGAPAIPEIFAALTHAIPLQLLAAELAVRRGRTPGEMTLATKVTVKE